MKYLIFTFLMYTYIIFTTDVKAVFTKDDCVNCCQTLGDKADNCSYACNRKFSMTQDYNSRVQCFRSCTNPMGDCKNNCIQDCIDRYDDEAKPKSRFEKKRLYKREVFESAGLPVQKTTTGDPNRPKRFRKSKYRDAPSGSSVH